MNPEFYKNILDNFSEGVYFVDQKRNITYWNHAAQLISGFSSQEVVGRNCSDNLLKHITDSGEELCCNGCPLSRTLLDGQRREAEVYLHHKQGHRVPVTVRISPLHDENGAILGAVEVFSDTSSRLRIQNELKELKHQTLLDPLTGLGNRRSLAREFDRRLGELRRYNIPFGVLFVDIDNFKRVNDTCGHRTGDQVLVSVAKTLQSALRDMDMVCRWGGEEFLAVVPRVDEAAFQAVAERMRRFVEASPIPGKNGPLCITVSVGGVLADPLDTQESLAARADAMMYKAKQSGRNCTRLDTRQNVATD